MSNPVICKCGHAVSLHIGNCQACTCEEFVLPEKQVEETFDEFLNEPPSNQKFPRLFYYEEGINKWISVPEKVSDLMDIEMMSESMIIEIQFKRVNMTNTEFDPKPM